MIPAKIQKTENPNLHGFEVHRPSSKGTKLLFQVIKAIINQYCLASSMTCTYALPAMCTLFAPVLLILHLFRFQFIIVRHDFFPAQYVDSTPAERMSGRSFSYTFCRSSSKSRILALEIILCWLIQNSVSRP